VAWVSKCFDINLDLFDEVYNDGSNYEFIFKDNIDEKNPIFNLLYPISESYEFIKTEISESAFSKSKSSKKLLKRESRTPSISFVDDYASLDKSFRNKEQERKNTIYIEKSATPNN